MTTSKYVPSEALVRIDYRNAAVDGGEADVEFDRFLSRIRREAIGEVIQELQRVGMTDASSYLIGYRDRRQQ